MDGKPAELNGWFQVLLNNGQG